MVETLRNDASEAKDDASKDSFLHCRHDDLHIRDNVQVVHNGHFLRTRFVRSEFSNSATRYLPLLLVKFIKERFVYSLEMFLQVQQLIVVVS